MAYRNGNYSAFYVTEPFNPSALGAHATRDFVYYNQLRMWKGQDSAFPFNDSHDKTYEEINYGINDQGLPVIVVYPEYASESDLLIGQTRY